MVLFKYNIHNIDYLLYWLCIMLEHYKKVVCASILIVLQGSVRTTYTLCNIIHFT